MEGMKAKRQREERYRGQSWMRKRKDNKGAVNKAMVHCILSP